MLRVITNNWMTKLMALALAVIVWLYANSVVVTTREIREVRFEIAAPTNVQVDIEPATKGVTITVRGPSSIIDPISGINLQILHKIEDIGNWPEKMMIPLELNQSMVFPLPANVQVVEFIPPVFELTIRPRGTLTVPVTLPQISGKPAAGYRVGRVKILGNQTVTIEGTQDVLNNIKNGRNAVDVMPVDVTNYTSSIPVRRPIVTQVSFDGGKTFERIRCNDTVQVLVEILRPNEKKTIKGILISPLVTAGASEAVVITSPNPIDIEVEGPPDKIRTITAEQLTAVIDVRTRLAELGGRPEDEKYIKFHEPLVLHGLPEGVRIVGNISVEANFKEPPRTGGGTSVP